MKCHSYTSPWCQVRLQKYSPLHSDYIMLKVHYTNCMANQLMWLQLETSNLLSSCILQTISTISIQVHCISLKKLNLGRVVTNYCRSVERQLSLLFEYLSVFSPHSRLHSITKSISCSFHIEFENWRYAMRDFFFLNKRLPPMQHIEVWTSALS